MILLVSTSMMLCMLMTVSVMLCYNQSASPFVLNGKHLKHIANALKHFGSANFTIRIGLFVLLLTLVCGASSKWSNL